MRRIRFSRPTIQVFLSSVVLMAVISCEAPVERPKGYARVLEDAKETFGQSRFDKALDFSSSLATATPPNEFTERGQVLSIILANGLAQGYKDLGEAYRDGAEEMKTPADRTEFTGRRFNYFQYAKTNTLQLAEISTRFIQDQGEGEAKELTVECPYPSVEPPAANPPLERVTKGMRVEPAEQQEAEVNAIRIGMRRSLAGALGVDRAQVGAALASGSAKVSSPAFCLFISRQLMDNAETFAKRALNEPRTRGAVLDRAEAALHHAQALLEASPDKDLGKTAKDLAREISRAKKKKT